MKAQKPLLVPPLSRGIGWWVEALGPWEEQLGRTLPYSTVVAPDQSQLCHIRAGDKYTPTCALLPASHAPTNIPLRGCKGRLTLDVSAPLYPYLAGEDLMGNKGAKNVFSIQTPNTLYTHTHTFTDLLPVLLSCN